MISSLQPHIFLYFFNHHFPFLLIFCLFLFLLFVDPIFLLPLCFFGYAIYFFSSKFLPMTKTIKAMKINTDKMSALRTMSSIFLPDPFHRNCFVKKFKAILDAPVGISCFRSFINFCFRIAEHKANVVFIAILFSNK